MAADGIVALTIRNTSDIQSGLFEKWSRNLVSIRLLLAGKLIMKFMPGMAAFVIIARLNFIII